MRNRVSYFFQSINVERSIDRLVEVFGTSGLITFPLIQHKLGDGVFFNLLRFVEAHFQHILKLGLKRFHKGLIDNSLLL